MNGLQKFSGKHPGKLMLFLAALALSLLAGCASSYYSQASPSPYMLPGAGLGAALGAGLGAAINHNNPWRGAAIGGLFGAAGGGVAGEAYGRYRNQNQPQNYPPQQSQSYYQTQPQSYDQEQPYYQ
jgi:uncharacterized membrane protein YebE (DUF533 family)